MTYVMSDIHGHARRFLDMLGLIKFSYRDTLYILGDVIDRGPDGIAILEYIRTQENIVLIIGNHEELMLQALGKRARMRPDIPEIWIRNGANPTYQGFQSLDKSRQEELLNWLDVQKDMREIVINNNRYILVHASPSKDKSERLWERINPVFFSPIPGKTVIFGHTPSCYMHLVTDKYLRKCGKHIKIDKGHGWIDVDCGNGMRNMRQACLGCLRLDDMAEFYTMA